MGEQRVWIEVDLIFLHETTHWRDFGDTFYRFERVTQVPILNRTQLCQVELVRIINERVLVNPADAGRVRADRRVHAFGKSTANRIQVFDDPRTRPVDVSAVLKNYVNERFPKHRLAANKSHFRRSNECGGDRISDLVFDQIGRASFPFGVNDHLRIA